MTVAVPDDIPPSTPPGVLIVATVGGAALQVPGVVASCRVTVELAHTVGVPVIGAGNGLTVNDCVT